MWGYSEEREDSHHSLFDAFVKACSIIVTEAEARNGEIIEPPSLEKVRNCQA